MRTRRSPRPSRENPSRPQPVPARSGPSPRQRRALSKIGLMLLTPSEEIRDRFGITLERIRAARGGGSSILPHHFSKVHRFRNHPRTRPLLEHPKLWMYARIAELAAHKKGGEIREILLSERARNPQWQDTPIPTPRAINAIIRRQGLASAEERIAKRNNHRKRLPNGLSSEERTLLMAEITPFIEGLVARYGENRRAIVEKVIAYEVRHAPNLPADPNIRRATFIRYLQEGRRFIASRIKRETIKERKKTLRQSPAHEEEHTTPPTIRLRTGVKLGRTERLILAQLQQGIKPVAIAHTLGVSRRTVRNALKKLRRVVTIE